jgi:glycerol-3-phosphate acyltransferase PlsY
MLHGKVEFVISFALMSAILLWRHRPNMRNLLAGTETKIGAEGK